MSQEHRQHHVAPLIICQGQFVILQWRRLMRSFSAISNPACVNICYTSTSFTVKTLQKKQEFLFIQEGF